MEIAAKCDHCGKVMSMAAWVGHGCRGPGRHTGHLVQMVAPVGAPMRRNALERLLGAFVGMFCSLGDWLRRK